MTEILLYDRIEAPTAKLVRDRLAAAGRGPVDVRIHSPGGSLFAGMAIHAALTAHPGRVIVHIDGTAASIASVIAMAGDEIRMAENAFFMIHDPAMTIEGGAADLRTAAELVDKTREQIVDVYARRTKADRETLTRLMSAETWLDANEAARLGFADVIDQARRVAAAWQPAAYFTNPPISETDSMSATIADIRAACPSAPADFILGQVEAGATVDQARAAWLDERERELAEREKQLARQPSGVPPLSAAGKSGPPAETGDGDFAGMVQALVDEGTPRCEAVRRVGRRYPDLHAQYVADANPSRPSVQNLIAERFSL